MNNWGTITRQYVRHRTLVRTYAAHRRRALIDDEDACPETNTFTQYSLDGFCREQQLRIEAVFDASVARVRAAQMAHNEEGWDDDIPRTPQHRIVR